MIQFERGAYSVAIDIVQMRYPNQFEAMICLIFEDDGHGFCRRQWFYVPSMHHAQTAALAEGDRIVRSLLFRLREVSVGPQERDTT